MTQDQILAILGAARPLIAALVGIGGTFGLYEASDDGVIVQGIIALATAGIPLGLMIWGYVHSKNTVPVPAAIATGRVMAASAKNDVAPAALTKAMIAEIPDAAHAAAKDKVTSLDANGGVPAPK